MIELGKEKKKVPGKDKWETPATIPLIPLVGLNHRQDILHMPRIMVHYYSTDETINQFAIGCIINPSLNCNKVLRIQVGKCLSLSFAARTMETIKDCLRKINTCVMALIIIYENNGETSNKVYILLSCVVYYLIYNYACIYYLPCQSKVLSFVSSKTTF